MPEGAHQECRHPRCSAYAVAEGFCSAHRYYLRERIAGPKGSNLTTHNKRFMWMRRAFMSQHPFCAVCSDVASVLDHITPHRGNRNLFWDQTNWQALCKPCHARKTAREIYA